MKIVFCYFALFALPLFCSSQDSTKSVREPRLSIGVKISLDRSGISKFTEHTNFREHINFGIPIYKQISKSFQIETGIYYVNKNTDISISDNQSLLINYSFANVRIPIMVRLKTQYFYTSVGLYGDYFLDYSSEETYYDNKFNYKINNLTAGIAFNFGISGKLTNNINLFMEAGLSRDLTSLAKNEDYFKFLNYGFSIGTSINFY